MHNKSDEDQTIVLKIQSHHEFHFWSGFILVFFFLVSCSPSKQQYPTSTEQKVDSFPPPKVTVFADLPDSLQPKVTFLDQVPKPLTTDFLIPPPSKIFVDSLSGLTIPPEAQGTGLFTHFTSEEGLCSDIVHCSFMDKNGELWFGTMGAGVSRYDGKKFTSYSTENGLPSNNVWCIEDDRFGNIWFATLNGLSRYDGHSFVNISTEQGLSGNDIGSILEDDAGNLWFSPLGHGLICYDGKTFTNFTTEQGLSSNDVWCMTKDHEGNIWCGTRGGGFFYFDPRLGNKATFSKLPVPEMWVDKNIMSIYKDHLGKMWIGTGSHGLLCYHNNAFINYSSTYGLKSGSIFSIQEDSQGALWIGTPQGVYKFDNQNFIRYGEKQGLTNKFVNCMIKDKTGNLWMGTYGAGVFQYGGESFVNFKTEPLRNNISKILEDRSGHLWFGTLYKGLSVYDGNSITTFTIKEGLSRNGIGSVAEDKNGDIWFSAFYGGGVGRLHIPTMLVEEPSSLTIPPNSNNQFGLKAEGLASLTTFTSLQGLAHDAVYSIKTDKAGNLWFATYGGGLSKFDGKSFTTFTTAQGLASNDINTLIEDSRGNIWLCYIGADGITNFNGTTFSNFTTSQGLPDNSINIITEDLEGNIWFSTEKGLCLLRREKAIEISETLNSKVSLEGPIFETFTTLQGLPSNAIYDVLPDKEGNLFVSTHRGFVFLKGGLKAFSDPGCIEIFSASQGYPIRRAGLIVKDRQGIIWVTTDSDNTGLVRFNQNALHKSNTPPILVIQRVKINNENISWNSLMQPSDTLNKIDSNVILPYITEEVNTFGRALSLSERDSLHDRFDGIQFDSIAKWHPVPLQLILPYHHNNITLDFMANVTARNQVVRYQYFLEGYDKDWSPISENSSATFGNIHEGHYNFKVKARSPDGVWSEPLSYTFTVLPPMHRTWWAYSLYSLAFLSLIYTGNRFQKRKTIRSEQEKANQKQAILNERLRISRDLHDEVGATLSGISMYSHIAKEQIKSESRETVLQSLNVMQESAGEMVTKLSDIVWLLNPDQAHLRQLVDKLEEYATQLAEMKGIQVKADITDKIADIELPIEVRRNIYLIFKEAINNSIKYSQATTLDFYIRAVDQTLEFVLEDNGVGFDAEMIRKGNGLNNMQHRADEIGAEFSITKVPASGTRVTLKCKIT